MAWIILTKRSDNQKIAVNTDQILAVIPANVGSSLMFGVEMAGKPYVVDVIETFDIVGGKFSAFQ